MTWRLRRAGAAQGRDPALRKSQTTLQTQLDAKHDSVINAVHFATHVVEKFNAADVWAKRRIVQVLGGSYVLTDKALNLEKHPLLQYIAENKKAIEQAIRGSGKQKQALFSLRLHLVAPTGPLPNLSGWGSALVCPTDVGGGMKALIPSDPILVRSFAAMEEPSKVNLAIATPLRNRSLAVDGN